MDHSHVRVVGGGVEQLSPPRAPRAAAWLTGGVLIGLLVGYAFFPSFEGGDGSGAAPNPVSDFATEEIIDPVAEAVSLVDLIPHLKGSLVVTLGVDDFELAIWPAELESPHRINIGDATPSDGYTFPPVAWDATSSRYAFVRTLDADETVLYVGIDTEFTPLVRDVTRFAWHATKPGQLAWTATAGDGETQQLFTMQVAGSPTLDGLRLVIKDSYRLAVRDLSSVPAPAVTVPATDQLVGWDDAGFILSYQDPELGTPWIRRIDDSGTEIGRVQGTVVAWGPDGSMLLTRRARRDALFYVVDPDLAGLVALEWAPTDAWGRVRPAALAADGRIAFTTFLQRANDWKLEIWGGDGVRQSVRALPGRVWDVGWSPDGRYVVMPGFDSLGDGGHIVLVYDTETFSLHEIDFDSRVSSALIR